MLSKHSRTMSLAAGLCCALLVPGPLVRAQDRGIVRPDAPDWDAELADALRLQHDEALPAELKQQVTDYLEEKLR